MGIESKTIIFASLIAISIIFSPLLIEATHVNSHNKAPGAIFTTTPDGGIVNENVHYTAKKEVYLDGGPPPHAPAGAAGRAARRTATACWSTRRRAR